MLWFITVFKDNLYLLTFHIFLESSCLVSHPRQKHQQQKTVGIFIGILVLYINLERFSFFVIWSVSKNVLRFFQM